MLNFLTWSVGGGVIDFLNNLSSLGAVLEW